MSLMSAQSLTSLLRRGVTTAVVCALTATALTLADGERFGIHLSYSLAIGLIAWLVIDVGHVVVHRDSALWPHGRRDFMLVALGIVCGFIGGNMIGDALTGRPVLDFLEIEPRKLARSLALTLAASIGICHFYYTRGRARWLQGEVALAQRDALEAKLKLLETQLAPHMLFNTLANLRVLIASDSARAIAMLDQLDRYLRATLAGSRALSHPLETEFARLTDYLELMSVRMGARLRYQLELPASLNEVPVPPLLLQPLVENAIRHGLEPLVAGGAIRVCAHGDEGLLVVDVVDTGVGLGENADGSGFGLTQVRERLASLYGARATLTLMPAVPGGTHVSVRLPLRAAAFDTQL